MKISIMSLKGGVGKTTTAVYLAEVMAKEAPTLLIDTDASPSAFAWHTSASPSLQAKAITLEIPERSSEIVGLAQKFTHIVIDTPPESMKIAIAAAGQCDLAIIPTNGSALEVRRLKPTLDIIAGLGVPAVILFTRMRNTNRHKMIVDVLDDAEMPIFKTSIPLRSEIEGSAEQHFSKLHGYELVWEEIKEIMKEINT
jgi:chromosome partitioning protein